LDFIKKNVFLITGGTGSFGETMVKKLLKKGAPEIRVLSRDEKKQEELRNKLKNSKVKFFIGDVRDNESIASAFIDVDYVFHAAALKQVPSCEFYPLEALKTNSIGTENVINQSILNNIKKTVLLSTDKAVYPINAMGMTKAIAEKILIAKSMQIKNKKTILSATRYGNVMGSRGSVIPLFIDQIKSNKPITITDPNMTRFLMSLNDSIDLVIKTFENSNQGEIYIMNSPSVTMKNLTNALIEIFNSKSKVRTIGTRHGEKLYETLISREEITRSSRRGKYYIIKPDNRSLNYEQYFNKGKKMISMTTDINSHNSKLLSVPETIKLLLKMDFINSELQ
tara:strand:- start:4205 stop:5218 length:1014 start_codon:yes stop_codon:yes gene_type:complete